MRRRINDPRSRRAARRERDWNWAFMERLATAPVHVSLWNKHRKVERKNELLLCLLGGVDLMSWVREHRSWFGHGVYNPDRTTFLFWLTPVGRIALRKRSRRVDEAVFNGGLVDPGYQVAPARDFHRDLREQLSRVPKTKRPIGRKTRP